MKNIEIVNFLAPTLWSYALFSTRCRSSSKSSFYSWNCLICLFFSSIPDVCWKYHLINCHFWIENFIFLLLMSIYTPNNLFIWYFLTVIVKLVRPSHFTISFPRCLYINLSYLSNLAKCCSFTTIFLSQKVTRVNFLIWFYYPTNLKNLSRPQSLIHHRI